MRVPVALTATVLVTGAALAQTPQIDIHGDCNAVGNNNSITCTWSRADFTEELGNALVAKMPDKKRLVDLDTVGGNLDQIVGAKVEKFLISHGYTIGERRSIGVMSPPPDHPFTLQAEGNRYHVIAAPSAH